MRILGGTPPSARANGSSRAARRSASSAAAELVVDSWLLASTPGCLESVARPVDPL